MKVALCLSGQPRFWKRGYEEQIYPKFIEGYDVDVFIHTWNISEEQYGKPYINAAGHSMGSEEDWPQQGDLSRLVDLYRPASCLMEDQISFPADKYEDRAMPFIRSDYTFSSFYSQQRACALKTLYEKDNGFVYDVVVRTRFDIIVDHKIVYEDLNLDRLTVSGPWPHHDGYNDNLVIGNSPIMNAYSNIYNHIDDMMTNTPTRFCGEMLVKTYIDSYMKVEVDQGPSQNMYR